MISIRKCRRCGKEFDAVIGVDDSLECEACRMEKNDSDKLVKKTVPLPPRPRPKPFESMEEQAVRIAQADTHKVRQKEAALLISMLQNRPK